jgi:hypothetical protein
MGIIERILLKLLRHEDITDKAGVLYLRRFFLINRDKKVTCHDGTVQEKRSWHVYLHKFYRGDTDRHLHDHPWPFKSLMLAGGYWEHRANPDHARWTALQAEGGIGDMCRLIEIDLMGGTAGLYDPLLSEVNEIYWRAGQRKKPEPPLTIRKWYRPGSFIGRGARWTHRVELPQCKFAWTLVFTGVKERDWGFHTENGWCFWKNYSEGVCAVGTEQ